MGKELNLQNIIKQLQQLNTNQQAQMMWFVMGYLQSAHKSHNGKYSIEPADILNAIQEHAQNLPNRIVKH